MENADRHDYLYFHRTAGWILDRTTENMCMADVFKLDAWIACIHSALPVNNAAITRPLAVR